LTEFAVVLKLNVSHKEYWSCADTVIFPPLPSLWCVPFGSASRNYKIRNTSLLVYGIECSAIP